MNSLKDLKLLENGALNGIKTTSDYYINTGQSEIRFLFRDRYYITLANNNTLIQMTPDQLWDSFDVNVLANFR